MNNSKVKGARLSFAVVAAAMFPAFGHSQVPPTSHPLRVEGRTLDGKPFAMTGRDAVLMCVMLNDAEHLRGLIAEGRDINTPLYGLPDRPTFLHLAVQKGHLEVTRVLLENGASSRGKTSRGVTPLSIAQDNHQARMIELLSEYSAK